jgi:hypothetical protein
MKTNMFFALVYHLIAYAQPSVPNVPLANRVLYLAGKGIDKERQLRSGHLSGR